MKPWLRALSALPLSLPFAFEPAPEPGAFLVRSAGARIGVACDGIDVAFAPGAAPLRIQFAGADPAARAVASEPLPGRVHHLIGRDPARWRRDLPLHGRLTCAGVRPGLDLAVYGRGDALEFDVSAAPGAELAGFELALTGADEAALTPAGDLALRAGGRRLVLRRPVAYQDVDGARRPIASRFVRRGPARLGFAVGAHDASLPLVIDPVLELSSYAGGNRLDTARAVAVDAGGFVLVAGTTESNDFPTTPGTLQPDYAGGNGDLDRGDAFVLKLAPGGASLVWATYFGGRDADSAEAVATGPGGDVFVAGATWSKDLPISPGAFQPERGNNSFDGYVARLGPDGDALVYATYLGGKDGDAALALAVDAANRATVAGYTYAKDFPVTPGAFQTQRRGRQDAFVTRLAPDGMSLVWSSLLGGKTLDAASGVALAADGGAVVAGGTQSNDFPVSETALQTKYAAEGDAFASKFAADGMSLAWSTYLGGKTGNPFAFDLASGVALDADENVYVVGQTLSRDFPVSADAVDPLCGKNHDCLATDAFAVKLAPDACALLYGTYLGDTDVDAARAVAVDARSHAHLTGFTFDKDYPVTGDAHQSEKEGAADAFLSELSAGGTRLVYSTFLGSQNDDAGNGVALGGALRTHVAGSTSGNDFPIAGSAFQPDYGTSTDGFVAVFGGVPAVEPALVASLALTPHPAVAGMPVAGLLTLRNAGSAAAANAVVDFTLEAGLAFGGATPSQGSCTLGVCALGALAPGAEATIDLAATPTAADLFTLTAEASADAADPVRAAACVLAEAHDLAVTALKAPKSVRIEAGEPTDAKVSVEIQNQSSHGEEIPDLATLADLVALAVTPTGLGCPAPAVALDPDAGNKLPLELAPNKKLKVDFVVTLDCADTDFVCEASVDHAALDGLPDSDPADDVLGGGVIDAEPR